MPLGDATPTIVAAGLLRYLAHNTVWQARTNRSYESEAESGDTIDIVGAGTVSIVDYDPSDGDDHGVSWPRYAPGAKVSVSLNQKKAIALRVDDVDEKQSRPVMLTNAIEVAGKELARVIDDHVKGVFHSVPSKNHNIGASGSKIDFAGGLDATETEKIKLAFAAAAKMMDDNKIPMDGRWAIVGPTMHAALNLIYSAGQLGDATLQDTLRNGFSGRLFGMQLYVTGNPVSAANQEMVMFGNDYAVAHVVQLQKVERMRLEQFFADGYRTLAVYGSAIAEAAGLGEATFHYDNAPAFS